ncbi:TPA: Hpt domain-containing protein [Legionella pneumophila]|nr:Hpt domain-containing protein [Legionella pneumophila]HAT2066289.1 Hpt domain-containing protein [Legionella pneumophila]HAT8592129.1 Hpt domain-containing protein [Legionella pneumophila]HAU1576310.1 Hpt domain-containing protein [Legionella pneumophila]HAU1680128.1 Hpt domain-containing protein [Legionella pneumophila]HAU3700371.1 Hpt domain-containing protein [Legionella pneumophila]
MTSSASGKNNQQINSLPTYSSDSPPRYEDMFNLASYPVLDVEEAIKFTLTEENLAEMLHTMLNYSLPDEVAEMKKFHDSGDWEKTQNIAHKIKGGCVYVGTVQMKMACQYFERYWKSGETELLEALYQQILNTIEKNALYIKNWLDKQK